MKKFILLSGAAALAACNQAEAPAPAEDTVEETVEETEAETSAGYVAAGNYNVAWPDGSITQFSMNEDGTFSTVVDGEEGGGTYEYVGGQICFTDSQEGAEADCWTNSEVAEDGSFTSVNADGEEVSLTVAQATAE